MIVPKAFIREWENNLDPGDKEKLEKVGEVSGPIITKAFKGEASEELIKKINKFFADKRQRIHESFTKQ